jgi:putative nucleotidyltransferase with HDIG domain
MLKAVLFVDDEPNLLDGLRRVLRPLRQEWRMDFAGSGSEALQMLERSPFDVVVTDMRMPGMDGAQLLSEVRARHPQLVRIILTGQCSNEGMLQGFRVAHRRLTKPCDPDLLRTTLQQACALRELLADGSLRGLVSQQELLPSLPAMYLEVVKALDGPDPSLAKVGQIIARDPGMTAKLLQVTQSARFGVRVPVCSPTQAAMLLGAENMKTLVLALNIFAPFDRNLLQRFALDAVWEHSQQTSALAQQLAEAEQAEPHVVECASMAGLLHDAGKLILADRLPDAYAQALQRKRRDHLAIDEAERAVFGTSHAEVGAYLFHLWGLPEPLVEAVAWHHRPAECPGETFTPLTAVHVANALLQEADQPAGNIAGLSPDAAYLDRLGLGERLPAWRELRDRVQRGSKQP